MESYRTELQHLARVPTGGSDLRAPARIGIPASPKLTKEMRHEPSRPGSVDSQTTSRTFHVEQVWAHVPCESRGTGASSPPSLDRSAEGLVRSRLDT